MAGFWKAPRALARLLAERELTPNAYALLNFVCQSGADRDDGWMTTNGYLAAALRVDPRTVRRGLLALRAAGLIDYADHERVSLFTIRTADTLRTLETAAVSAAVSAGSADSTPSATSPEPAPQAELWPTAAADSRARARGDRDRDLRTLASLAPRAPARAREAASGRTNERPRVDQEGEAER